MGFVLTNESSVLQLMEFAVPVDQVEQITNLNFFHLLPDDIEEELESVITIGKWDR